MIDSMNRRAFGFTAAMGVLLSGKQIFSQEIENTDFTINEMVMGDENAAVTLYEYASFTCVHCARFHKNVFPLLKKNYIDTGKVKFIYREIFFDAPGLWASLLARCGDEKKFFGIVDILYEKQQEWASGDNALIGSKLKKIGKIAGFSEETLNKCFSDREMAKALLSYSRKNATANAVRSTPSLIIDGVNHGNMPYTDLAKIIDEKL